MSSATASFPRTIGLLAVAACAVVWTATGCSTWAAYKTPFPASPVKPGPGERIGVDRVMVLVDASGSIDARESFPTEKAWLESFVQGMPQGSYDASIRSFGGTRRRGGGLAPFDRAALATQAKDLDYLGGDSPLAEVLGELALATAGQGGRTAVVLVSDGVANPAKWGEPEQPALEAGKEVVAKAGGPVCFHTVQVGHVPAGRTFLEMLSKLTDCGSFRRLGSMSDAKSLGAFERTVFISKAAPAPAPAKAGDADRDGVADAKDACPGTPMGARVDERGCWVLTGVRFASNSADIVGTGGGAIDHVADVLRANPGLRIRIEGHTDSSGSATYNQQLSERRAAAVKQALVARDIDAGRLEVRGLGEDSPVADNSTPEGRAANRRIEFTVLP